MPLASSTLFHLLLCFVSVALVSGHCRHPYVADGGDPGTGGSHHCRGHLRHSGTCCRNFYPGGYYSAAIRDKDAEDWTTLVERETLERVSRVEVENAVALASAHEDAEGFVRKITLLEDELVAERQVQEMSERECREQFEDLTLL
jgi:hypothetical protein